jgi:cytochrome c-type biogenesis protein CcmH
LIAVKAARFAVLKAKVRQLPLPFEVDDSLALTPDNRLSAHQRVSVAARVARSGEAAPAAGDFEGVQLGVSLGDDSVRVVIDRVRP